ncbi:MAG: hypothetical protein JW783_12845 [Bacteroidales bacterium]|nr:hypothetical protein [Bacteroidales bacterium]MBN2749302.1 hypothetical protein [Bacteroidales bacterium]
MKLGLMTRDECIDFVEFNITGDGENYNKCDPESLFLNMNLFNIFACCFERSNHLFEIPGQNMYNVRKIVPLQNELLDNLTVLGQIRDIEQFKEYVTSIFLGKNLLNELKRQDSCWEMRWGAYLRKLIQINKQIIRLTDSCVEQERVLWVIGY